MTPLPEPKGQRLAYRCVAGDGEDEYEDFYTTDQMRAYGAAEYKRAIEAASALAIKQHRRDIRKLGAAS